MKATTKFRELLKGDDIIITPGVYDCLTARLAETTGFTAVKLLGNVTCASLLGLPDLGLIGLNEMANHAKNVAAAVDIPVMVHVAIAHAQFETIHPFLAHYQGADCTATGTTGIFRLQGADIYRVIGIQPLPGPVGPKPQKPDRLA